MTKDDFTVVPAVNYERALTALYNIKWVAEGRHMICQDNKEMQLREIDKIIKDFIND